MKKQQTDKIFNTILLVLLFLLIIGIPLALTPLTRSVFEVNKFLVLRIISIIVMFIWVFKYFLYKDNSYNNEKEESYGIGSYYWKKVGLEIPILIWIIFNIFSTIFSQNFTVAIIGAYDRWEGIISIINYVVLIYIYAKLVTTKTQLYVLLGGIIGSTLLSAIYGIFQSLGLDVMAWSVDPTQRVFACINNPVHFCAYVAMIVPVGIALLLYISSKEKNIKNSPIWIHILKWSVFVSTIIIYYTQFLSYSRATWMGFVGAMTLFYILVSKKMFDNSKNIFLLDFFVTSLTIAIFYISAIFHYQEKFPLIAIFINIIIIAYLFYLYIMTKAFQESIKNKLFLLLGLVIFYFNYIYNIEYLSALPVVIQGAYSLILSLSFIAFCIFIINKSEAVKNIFARFVIILIFTNLQFVAFSWTSMFLYFSLLICFYYLVLKQNQTLLRIKKFWLLTFLTIFAIVIIIPAIPAHIQKINSSQDKVSSKTVLNAEEKIESYRKVAIEGTARTSMWKSAIPWIKDYWLLGSGPDTIKYMYPKYRLTEYGILEGGHNFTPDRLHNEYLNTLATRGIPSFIIYYFGIILGWYLLVLKSMYQEKNNPLFYLKTSFLAGVTIYLGQVMFNFGVVATLFIFYILMGLGIAISSNSAFKED